MQQQSTSRHDCVCSASLYPNPDGGWWLVAGCLTRLGGGTCCLRLKSEVQAAAGVAFWMPVGSFSLQMVFTRAAVWQAGTGSCNGRGYSLYLQ